jgi:hypothetical protein
MNSRISSLASLLLFFCLSFQFTKATTSDTVTNTLQQGQSLKYSESIVSANGNFELCFFSPGNSTKYYLGIRYNKVSEQNVVWVANRKYPFPDSSAILTVDPDGNLVISDSSTKSTVANTSTGNGTYAMLLDTGNLILTNKVLEVFWQSFKYPTDTLLPGMEPSSLTSWKSSEDPAPGLFSLQMDSWNQLTIKEGSKVYWTSSISTFGVFAGDWSWPIDDTSVISRMVLDVSGQLKLQSWSEDDKKWNSLQSSRCGDYAFCGAFSICNETAHVSDVACSCLQGFKPNSADTWRHGNASSGCVRKTALQCGNNTVQRDGFLRMSKVDWPGNPQQLHIANRTDCELACLNNCSCMAYAYDQQIDRKLDLKTSCLVWVSSLLNLKQLSENDKYGNDFYLKLAPSDLVTPGKKYIYGAFGYWWSN